MRSTYRGLAAGLIAMFALVGCRSGQAHIAPPVTPTAQTEWLSVLAAASQEASAGRHALADKLLSDFSVRFPATREATEAVYWRALYRLDPANANASARESVALLDSYLSVPTASRRPEAQALRRVAAALESRGVPSGPVASNRPEATPTAADKAYEDEIQRLKDELAKANAELERIKRRLAQPKP